MPEQVTFQRKQLAGYFVITSEQLPGLHVTAKTEDEAERALAESVTRYLEVLGKKTGKARIVKIELERSVA